EDANTHQTAPGITRVGCCMRCKHTRFLPGTGETRALKRTLPRMRRKPWPMADVTFVPSAAHVAELIAMSPHTPASGAATAIANRSGPRKAAQGSDRFTDR